MTKISSMGVGLVYSTRQSFSFSSQNVRNAYIFTISKEKAAEYDKELTQFNVQIKQQLVENAKI